MQFSHILHGIFIGQAGLMKSVIDGDEAVVLQFVKMKVRYGRGGTSLSK